MMWRAYLGGCLFLLSLVVRAWRKCIQEWPLTPAPQRMLVQAILAPQPQMPTELYRLCQLDCLLFKALSDGRFKETPRC